MSSASLLSRMAKAADPHSLGSSGGSSGRSLGRSDDLESAVVAHLMRLLNARKGNSLSAPDFGVPDPSELFDDIETAARTMQRCVKDAIVKHERRLKNVHVRALPSNALSTPDGAITEGRDPMKLYLEITAQLVCPGGKRRPMLFTSTLNAAGQMVID